jgi:hydroxymethylglutaryl-CoA lyase
MTAITEPAAQHVTLVEVGPRDGLQNERVRLTTDQKVDLIGRLVNAGLRHVEVGSFVHPKWIPQMADTAEVMRRLPQRDDVAYWALVPNLRGLEGALDAGARHVAVFVSSSETHNRKNLNRTIAESLDGLADVVREALAAGVVVRGYVSTVFGCPYEGDVDFDRVLSITERLLEMGVWQVSLGDTTGMGTPLHVQRCLLRALDRFGNRRIALHLHDTRGVGVANALVALEAGMRWFDTSIGGMGGCPYAPGAAGNLGTEDLVHLLSSTGVDSGIDLGCLGTISRLLENDYGATLNSAYHRYVRSGQSPRCA